MPHKFCAYKGCTEVVPYCHRWCERHGRQFHAALRALSAYRGPEPRPRAEPWDEGRRDVARDDS
jgi:hypothetical protein